MSLAKGTHLGNYEIIGPHSDAGLFPPYRPAIFESGVIHELRHRPFAILDEFDPVAIRA